MKIHILLINIKIRCFRISYFQRAQIFSFSTTIIQVLFGNFDCLFCFHFLFLFFFSCSLFRRPAPVSAETLQTGERQRERERLT